MGVEKFLQFREIIIGNDVIDLDISRKSTFISLVLMIDLVGSRKLGILINTAETDFKRDLKLYNIRTCDGSSPFFMLCFFGFAAWGIPCLFHNIRILVYTV